MNPSVPSPGPAFAKARVIGIGKAGAEMVLNLHRTHPHDLSFAVIDADAAAIQTVPLPDTLFVGGRLTRGFGAGGDPDLARAAAEEELASIRALCQGYPIIFVVAGLGGGSGTGIAPIVARVARESGASVFAFVTTPFDCEGSRRQQQAFIGLHRLKTVADGVLCLPNEKMFVLANERATLLDAFRASREHIRDAVMCIWNLLTRPGLLNVSYSGICSVLRGPNLESAFARVTAEGPTRADQALERLLEHPLIAKGETLRRAEAVLVSFQAGSDLGMGEVRKIMDELIRRSDGARVVMGAALDETCGSEITLTVVASTRQITLPDGAEEPASVRTEPRLPRLTEADRTEAAPAGAAPRSSRHFAPLAPELTPEQAGELLKTRSPGRHTKKKPQQVQLPFEIITKGRFEKCEPTVRRGHNLDQPTYLRRGIALN